MFKSAKRTTRLFFLGATTLLVACLVFSGIMQITYSETSGNFTLPCTIETYGDVWDGEIAFGLLQTSTSNGPIGSYLVIMNTDGDVGYLRQTSANGLADQSYEIVKNIAPNMTLFTGEGYYGGANTAPLFAAHIWDYVSNTTEDFPDVVGHHDIEYNPLNNTFLTLQEYVRQVGDNKILFDKIVELDASGTVLWSWDTYDHVPLSEADPFNLTSTINGQTVMDFSHANTLDWDYNNSIVYLNLRNLNTFYKIDQNTSDVIWACGEFGNFTLLAANGTEVSSLWYHSHDVVQVAPDVFSMFDNDFDNVTNPNDCHSRMIEVKLDEQDMTAHVSWSWEAPKQYWSPYWGSVMQLPNGDRMGVFGTQTHRFSQNTPYTTNDTGAVIVEVNPQGDVVRTYTFPAGWGIYRVQQIFYPTDISEPPPTIDEISGSQTILIVGMALAAVVTLVAVMNLHSKKRKQ